MPNPPKSKQPQVVFPLRFRPEDYDTIKAAAASRPKGVTIAEYIRRAALRNARRDLKAA